MKKRYLVPAGTLPGPPEPGKRPLRPFQERELQHQADPCRVLPWHPRAGKTLPIARSLASQAFERSLVIAPKLAAQTSWARELFDQDVLLLCHGTLRQRAEALSGFKHGVAIVNPEAVALLLGPLLAFEPQAIVVDESHLFKSASSKRTRALWKLGKRTQWRRLLSGTIAPNHLGDVYAPFKFLDSTVFGTSYERFANYYLIREPMWHRVVGYNHVQELTAKVQQFGEFVSLADINFGNPNDVRVGVVNGCKKEYDELKMLGVNILGQEFTYEMVVHQLLAQQELAGGFLYDAQHEPHWISSHKIDALKEELQQFDSEPIVVFYRFNAEGKKIVQEIAGAKLLDGEETINAFQRKEIPVLVVQESQGLGYSLDAARTAIFYSFGFNFASHYQARQRILHPKYPSQYIYLLTEGTVDEFVLGVLNNKSKIMELLSWMKS